MIRDAVTRYATRFHRVIAGRHAVASPFGAWLLLALVAPAAEGAARDELTDALGCDAEEAFTAATALLRGPHPEVALGSAVWHDPRYATDRLLELVRRLSPPADAGPIPSQPDADAWARKRTLGLIERFPIDTEGGDPLAVLLATAIAAKVSWEVSFRLAAPSEAVLPVAAGFADLPLLRDPGAAEWVGLLDTEAGIVAAHTAVSRHGLAVTSMVGHPAVDPAELLDLAQRHAVDVVVNRPPAPRPLFELPLGDGPAWRITEDTVPATGVDERYEVLLPTWEVDSVHDLMQSELGFPAAADALVALLVPDDYYAEARQSAMARYTREGFEAAAVTSLGVRATAAVLPRRALVRTARIEFTRPHAVVAVTQGTGDWDGLPVFVAWVEQAVPAR